MGKLGARPGRRIRPGEEAYFEKLSADVLRILEDGGSLVRFNYEGIFEEILTSWDRCPCLRI